MRQFAALRLRPVGLMKFAAENGWGVVDFEVAINAVYQDTRMIRQKRQEMKKAKMWLG